MILGVFQQPWPGFLRSATLNDEKALVTGLPSVTNRSKSIIGKLIVKSILINQIGRLLSINIGNRLKSIVTTFPLQTVLIFIDF